ncbi:magnesium transporter CorA family protein [Candidatus Woesearchaeota archaeon]|nr:magnesium transporter CorA family protein [Candidatus Woesearchaeota archaeon]
MIEIFVMPADRIERAEHTSIEESSRHMDSGRKGTVWVRCVKPVIEDIETVAALTGIPLDELKESVEGDERSKVSIGRHIEIIFRAPLKEDGEVVTVPIRIYAAGNTVVTVEGSPTRILSELSYALVGNRRRFLFRKPTGYFIYYVLDKVNDEFLYYIDKISINIEVFRKKTLNRQDIGSIYATSISLSYFNQSLIANIEVLNELRKSYPKLFSHEDRKHFSELYHDALQILDTEKIQRELLSNLFNMHSSIAGNELNYFMKIVALVALLSTLPNLITSIFSMNVGSAPIVQGRNAFYIILGMIVVSSVLSYVAYRVMSER